MSFIFAHSLLKLRHAGKNAFSHFSNTNSVPLSSSIQNAQVLKPDNTLIAPVYYLYGILLHCAEH